MRAALNFENLGSKSRRIKSYRSSTRCLNAGEATPSFCFYSQSNLESVDYTSALSFSTESKVCRVSGELSWSDLQSWATHVFMFCFKEARHSFSLDLLVPLNFHPLLLLEHCQRNVFISVNPLSTDFWLIQENAANVPKNWFYSFIWRYFVTSRLSKNNILYYSGWIYENSLHQEWAIS